MTSLGEGPRIPSPTELVFGGIPLLELQDTSVGALIAGRALKPFMYQDHGSLVSLARYATVGSLMGNLVGGKMAVEGRLARFVYMSLYRMHLIAIHGWWKGVSMILVGHVNQVVRPKLKLH